MDDRCLSTTVLHPAAPLEVTTWDLLDRLNVQMDNSRDRLAVARQAADAAHRLLGHQPPVLSQIGSDQAID